MVKWLATSYKGEKALDEGKCFSAKAGFNPGRIKEWAYDELQKGRIVRIKRDDTGAFVVCFPNDPKGIELP